MENNKYTNLVEATNGLNQRGFTESFKVTEDCKLHDENDGSFTHEEAKICEYHRFEGMTDPQDSSVIYAIELENGTKGVIIDAYGSDASICIAEFLRKIEEVNE